MGMENDVTRDDLEQVEGEKALAWVKAQNAKTEEILKTDPQFEQTKQEAKKILEDNEKIPYASRGGDGLYYNFWKDAEHPRGLLRRTTLEEYKKESPSWETVLDIDELAAKEDKNWIYKGGTYFKPDYDRSLVMLSDGGKDAVEIREFDLKKKEFVKDGFYVAEAKSDVSWLDKNTLLIGSDFGEGSLTDSGYPRVVKLWKRGTELKDAKTIFEGKKEYVSIGASVSIEGDKKYVYLSQSPSFFEEENYLYNASNNTNTKIPLPKSANFKGIFKGCAIAVLREDMQYKNATFKAGSVIAIDEKTLNTPENLKVKCIFNPSERVSIDKGGISFTKDYMLLETSNNVCGELIAIHMSGFDSFNTYKVRLPKNGSVDVTSCSKDNNQIMLNYESFIKPSTLFMHDIDTAKTELLKKNKDKFDASNMKVEQRMATSKDGTKVPYFIISQKDQPTDGSNPTLLYGYGGFEVSLAPSYLSVVGKSWLEKGGTFVLANIRGGGEFGPEWHQAALKQNRHKAYEDFEAIAEHLIETGVTSKEKLAIKGGSNGGLLMGASFTRRPDLFKAVICQVPLLDMLAYHKLLAGASWMGEYGNPEIPEERKYLESYSPLQNLKENVKYPEVFFTTSTKDDRVHPAHARWMAKAMQDMGNKVYYYEDCDGGHSAGANHDKAAYSMALQYSYLRKKLCQEDAPKSEQDSKAKETTNKITI